MAIYSIALGQIAVRIIPCIKCFTIKNQENKKKSHYSKKIILHYFILLFFYSIDSISTIFCFTLDTHEDKLHNDQFLELFSVKDGIQILLITILFILLLKYEYYIHHYISIFVFLVFSVSIDLILDNYSLLFKKKHQY